MRKRKKSKIRHDEPSQRSKELGEDKNVCEGRGGGKEGAGERPGVVGAVNGKTVRSLPSAFPGSTPGFA